MPQIINEFPPHCLLILFGSSLEQAEQLLDHGIQAMRVSDHCKIDAKSCFKKLDRISDTFVFSTENTEPFIQTAMTTLGSSIVKKCQR